MTSPEKGQRIINHVAQGEWLEALGAYASDTKLEIRRKHLKLSQEFKSPEVQTALNQALAMVATPQVVRQRPSQIKEPWLEELVIPKGAVQSPLSDTSAPTSSQDYTDTTTSVIPIPQMRLTRSLIVERIVLVCCLWLLALFVSLSQSRVIAPLIAFVSGTVVTIAGFVFFLAMFCEVSDSKKKRMLLRELPDIQTQLREAEKVRTMLHVRESSLGEEEQGHLASIDSRWRESNLEAKREVNANHEDLQKRLDEILVTKQLKIKNETRRALGRKRDDFLRNRLVQWTLDDAEIAGIGTNLKRQLMIAGIRSAADFVDIAITVSSYNHHQTKIPQIVLASGKQVRVPGIGLQKAKSLLAWRKNIDSIIEMELPQSLSPAEVLTIQQTSPTIWQLKVQEGEARQQFDVRKAQIGVECQRQHLELRRQILASQERCTIKQELQNDLQENRLLLCHLRQIFNTKRDELASCVKVNFVEYMKKILTPWG